MVSTATSTKKCSETRSHHPLVPPSTQSQSLPHSTRHCQPRRRPVKVTPRACLRLVVDVPIFQHDWCSIVMGFPSDILFCFIFPSSGVVFPVRSSFQQCLKTDVLAYNNPVRSCTVKFSVCSWVILSQGCGIPTNYARACC